MLLQMQITRPDNNKFMKLKTISKILSKILIPSTLYNHTYVNHLEIVKIEGSKRTNFIFVTPFPYGTIL